MARPLTSVVVVCLHPPMAIMTNSVNFQPATRKASRATMPYAAVMATTAAASRASTGPFAALAKPLLYLALAQAAFLALCLIWSALVEAPMVSGTSLAKARQMWPVGGPYGFSTSSMGAAHLRFGLFTIPVGLSVISVGLLSLHVSILGAEVALSLAIATALGLIILVPVWVALASRPRGAIDSNWLAKLDGRWFLGPASLLALALGLAVSSKPIWKGSAHSAALAAACLWWLGTVGYLGIVTLSGVRVRRYGLKGAARSPWWIAAGCGGLTAGSGGALLHALAQRVGPQKPANLLLAKGIPALNKAIAWGGFLSWIIGSALGVAVILLSCLWLWKKLASLLKADLSQHKGNETASVATNGLGIAYQAPPWTPTFSTGVYALGTLGVASITRVAFLHGFGIGAGGATIIIWAASTLVAVSRWLVPKVRERL